LLSQWLIVEQNIDEARGLFQLAADQGSEEAKGELEKLEEELD